MSAIDVTVCGKGTRLLWLLCLLSSQYYQVLGDVPPHPCLSAFDYTQFSMHDVHLVTLIQASKPGSRVVPNSLSWMNPRTECIDHFSSRTAKRLWTQESHSPDANPSSATQQLCDLGPSHSASLCLHFLTFRAGITTLPISQDCEDRKRVCVLKVWNVVHGPDWVFCKCFLPAGIWNFLT